MRKLLLSALGVFVLGWVVGPQLIDLAQSQVVPQPGPPGGIACAYNTTPPTLTNGQAGWVQCDSTGHMVPGAPTPPSGTGQALTGVSCGSAASSCVLKSTPGNFYGVYAECTSACWLMVFNAAAAPSNGATTAGNATGNLVECVDVSANGARSITYPTYPRAYSVGITVAISSTACATLTLSTVGFVSGTVM